LDVSIIRVGLAETKNFSDGYDAIFGKTKKAETPPPEPKAAKKPAGKAAKKKTKKK
jgi:hypothetical protein